MVTISCSFINSLLVGPALHPCWLGPALHLVRLVFLCYLETGVLGSTHQSCEALFSETIMNLLGLI
jgi:hypothetical protein